MEICVIWRGALSGFIAGTLALVFAKLLAEPSSRCCPRWATSAPTSPSRTSSASLGPRPETPQPITNTHGQILYPGFSADVLWKLRWYSILNMVPIWAATGLIFGALIERFLKTNAPAPAEPHPEPTAVSR